MKTGWLGVFLMVLTSALTSDAVAANDAWKAGASKAVITPTTPMWMAGYSSRDRPAQGKLHDLWVRAIAIEDASGKRVVMVTLDVCGIDRKLSTRIRDRIQQQHKLGREAVAICSNHTHSGPMVGDNLRGMNFLDEQQQKYVTDYTAELEEKVVATVADAINRLVPAKLAWAMGKATFAVNRRENQEAKVPALREAGQLKGPVDHELPVMTVTSADGDKPIAIVFGYACHGTTTAVYEWSGDWPTVACMDVEKMYPGATALCWIGCAGDQNPLPRRSYQLLLDYGRQAAEGVSNAINAGGMKPVAPAKITASYGEIDLPFDALPAKEKFEADLKSENKFVVNRAKILLGKIARDGKLATHYPYPVQFWRLGEGVRWVLLGGEVVVDYSLRLKKELGPEPVWIAAYANDVMAYIPSRRVLGEGRYEADESMLYYALPTKWAPEVEELVVKEVHRQAAEAK
jgi:hypothetical protein